MDGKCICETGEERVTEADFCNSDPDGRLSVCQDVDGKWALSVTYDYGYGSVSHRPIRFCPVCGREL